MLGSSPSILCPRSGLLPQDKDTKLSFPKEGTVIKLDRMGAPGSQESSNQLRQRTSHI